MAPRQFDVERIATEERELRRIFGQSAYAEIEQVLRFEPYFPRSLDRLLAESNLTQLTGYATSAVLGVMVGTLAISLWRMSFIPLYLAFFSVLPIVLVIRIAMPTVFRRTSETVRFIELVCFDPRPPVVYLRRFAKEDPPLPSLTIYNHLIMSVVNPRGHEPFENLAHVLGTLGPVLGLGRPADTGIEHRINRLFTADEHWQDVVRFFLRNSKAVLMCYEPTPILNWELQQSLQNKHATLYLMMRNLPREIVQNREAALAALPPAVRALDCPKHYVDKVSDSYFGFEYGLFVVVGDDEVRVHGVKMHYQQLWNLLFSEVLRFEAHQFRSIDDFPQAYHALGRAVVGRTAWWEVLAVAVGAGLGVWASLSVVLPE